MTILVIDDEHNIADGIAYTLGELDADVEIAVCYSAQEAKKFAGTHYLDIVVCDINMPRQNGLSLCRDLLRSYPELKIVFLTGHSDFSYAYEAMKLPDVSYVLKLENDDVLLRTVKEKMTAIEAERKKNADLLRERQLNRELSEQLGDLKLRQAVSDGKEVYGNSVFLLIRLPSVSDGLPEIVRNTFAGEVAVTANGKEILAAIDSDESVSVIEERAKRLQQDLYEQTGDYSTFVFDPPSSVPADSRFRSLSQTGGTRFNVLYFLNTTKAVPQQDGCDDEVIAGIADYIDKHLNEDLSLVSLASAVYYNPAYLSRKFKMVMGSTLHTYILGKRMELAKKLLIETDGFVQDIAARCGFSNSTQFGMAFAKCNGCSPGTFRRSRREQDE